MSDYARFKSSWQIPAVILYHGDNPIERRVWPLGTIQERAEARAAMALWKYDRARVHYFERGRLNIPEGAPPWSGEYFNRVTKSSTGVITQWVVYMTDRDGNTSHQITLPDETEAEVWIEERVAQLHDESQLGPYLKATFWVRKEYTFEPKTLGEP